jgi:hypothetical protein
MHIKRIIVKRENNTLVIQPEAGDNPMDCIVAAEMILSEDAEVETSVNLVVQDILNQNPAQEDEAVETEGEEG